MRSLLPLTVANLKSFVRDRSGLFWTLAFPIVFVLLFGAIFSGAGSDLIYSIGWVDEDGSPAAAGLKDVFGEVTVLEIVPADRESSLAAMRDGDVAAVVVVPSGYGSAIGAATDGSAAGGPGAPAVSLTLYTDPSNATTASTIAQIVGQVVAGVNQGITRAPTIVGIQAEALQAEDISSVAYIVPSILAMALMQLGLFGAIPLVEQREKLIFKRLGATPLKRPTLVGSNVIVRLMIAVVQAVMIVGIGIVIFNVAVLGSALLVGFLVVLGALTFIALGYVIAAFARTEETASATTSVLQFPLMFLSGIFFPFALMPPVLQAIGALMPLTYLGDALRQVMVGGAAFVPLPVDIAVLTGWLVVCLGISARFFRWQ
jgi:ABC-2 type transport system permease protein